MASKARIDRLLAGQSDDLARLTDRQTADFLRAFEDARRDLRERLAALQRDGGDEVQRFTAQHLRIALVQVEQGIAEMRARLGDALAGAERAQHEAALTNLLEVVRANEPEFKDTGGRVEMAALRRLTGERALLLHKYSVERYSAEVIQAIQRELTAAVVAQSTLDQVVKRIAGTDSVFARFRGRAALIARMELNRAYNDGHQAALEEAADLIDEPGTDDPLLKRADEFFDHRNHPFSRALHGLTAPVKGLWEVPAAEVARWEAELKLRSSGIVWPLVGNAYKGANYPAHYNDRGRQVPHRKSWDDEQRPPTAKPKGKSPKPPPVEGGFATEHEREQGTRFAELEGGGRWEATGISSGIEGRFHPADGRPAYQVAMKRMHDTGTFARVLGTVNANRWAIRKAGLTEPTVFYGEPLRFTVDDFAEKAKNGPLVKMPTEGTFNRLVFRCSDGVVTVDQDGVKVRRSS